MSVAFGEFVFDLSRRELRRNGLLLKVDPLQLDLLACFIDHPGRLLTKQELLDLVWEGRAVADNVLSVTVAKLRKALGHRPGEREYIENRYGRGYRFVPAVSLVDDLPPGQPASGSLLPPITPLVGRTDSLQRVEAALTRAISGQGGVCVLIGEPGIGKTRLAEALEVSARHQGTDPVWGRCQPGDSAPALWPFAQALRELSGSRTAERILQVVSDPPERDASAAGSDASSGLMQELAYASTSHHRTIDEATQTLFRLSKQQPLVILLDDLQWADAMSLRLLSYLVDDISRWPILIVTTVRSTELAPESRRNQDLSRLLRHRNCERIELTRLRPADIDEYVTAMCGASRTDISREVFARSEGNPFFMIELLRPWIGRPGELDPKQLQLSGLALDLVRQRVQTLPEAARSVLAAAAVIGHDFDLGLLSHVTERSHDELLEALDGSLANDTVIPSTKLAGAYAFDHELIREVLYADLPTVERCRLHHRAAEGLSRRRAAGGEVTSAELANHFLSALPQGDVAVAVEHARKAAAAAHRMAATADALALLRRALASLAFWVEPSPEVRSALLLELSLIERALGDSAYIEHLDQGVALAREHGFGALLTVAGRCLSLGPGILLHADAHSVLEAAAEVLPKTDERRRAIVLAHMAWTPPSSTRAHTVNALLGEAERLAESSGHADARAAVRTAKLFFLAGPDTIPQAEAIAAEIEREAREDPPDSRRSRPGSRRARPGSTALFRGIVAMQRGDKAALQLAIADRAGRGNNIEQTWHLEHMLLVQRINRGELKGVAQELDRLRDRARRLRLQAWRTVIAVDYGTLLLRTSEATTFDPRIRLSWALAHTDAPFTRARKIRGMADFGYLDDVRTALKEVSIESLYELPRDRDYISVLCNTATAAIAVQNTQQSEALYALLRPYPDFYAVDVSLRCDGSISYFLGRLARALGRDDAAREHLEHALERNEAFDLAPCVAETTFELASLLLDSPTVHDPERAQQLLEQAERSASLLGMKRLAGACARKRRSA